MKNLFRLIFLLFTSLACAQDEQELELYQKVAKNSEHAVIDLAGVFQNSPELKEKIENAMSDFEQKNHSKAYLITTRLPVSSRIGKVTSGLCSNLLADNYGFVVLYDAETKHAHFSESRYIPNEKNHNLPPFYGNVLVNSFVKANQYAATQKNLNPARFLYYVMDRFLSNNHAIIESSYFAHNSIWKKNWYLIPLFIAIPFVYWMWKKNKKISLDNRSYAFPYSLIASRLDAKHAGGITASRYYHECKNEVSTIEDFSIISQKHKMQKKSVLGKAMLEEMVEEIRDRTLDETQIMEKYGVSEKTLENIKRKNNIEASTAPTKIHTKKQEGIPNMPI